jgi:signal transduction histidine kinase
MISEIVGNPKEFRLEQRSFNVVLLATAIAASANFFFKSVQGTLVAPEVVGAIVISSFTLYFLARFGRYFEISWRVFSVLSYVFLGMIFMIRGRLDGPVVFLLFMVLAALLAVTPKRTQFIWLFAHGLLFSGMIMLGYFIDLPRQSSLDLPQAFAVDLITTFFLMLTIAYVVVTRVRLWSKDSVNLVVAKHQEEKADLIEENKHLNRLFSIVSHDVRAPLNSISGYLELLKHASLEPEAELKLRSDLLLLTRSTSMMLDQMLEWSRTQVDGYEPKIQAFSCEELLIEPVSILRPIGEFKSIPIHVECDPTSSIRTDATLFSSIVRNLLHNAIKFSPRETEVRLRLVVDHEQIVLEVIDQGLGLSDHDMKQILAHAKRSSMGTSGEMGMGVGMRICHEFSALLGGWLELVPTSPGTTIRVVFPKPLAPPHF